MHYGYAGAAISYILVCAGGNSSNGAEIFAYLLFKYAVTLSVQNLYLLHIKHYGIIYEALYYLQGI